MTDDAQLTGGAQAALRAIEDLIATLPPLDMAARSALVMVLTRVLRTLRITGDAAAGSPTGQEGG